MFFLAFWGLVASTFSKKVTMNSDCYQSVLENHLLWFIELHGCTHFLQDSAPCHAYKQIKAYLAESFPIGILACQEP
jgi:hypothetical protein